MARILIIDDYLPTRTALRSLFEKAGYEIKEASDGEAGIRLYHQEPADLVIVDILMPGKEGLETIRELKRDFPQIKIIAISGGGVHYLDMAREFGALHAFEKPFDMREILETVQKSLDE